ncbi:cysteine hydrolase family protein [Polyangium aurulentum]|uniref:cysteine hydrolase family protein n=1 Tax=Polyangium aurulentum TaxID=2567896 RepID=UPI001F30465B|nr:isochorismatase family protein [Polyangium aurulentum]
MNKVLVDVDVQRDFCEPSGALYVPGSPNDVFRALVARAVEARIPILGSVDSHAWDAWEFDSSEAHGPAGERPGFPDHCVKGTPGWLKVEGTLPRRFRFLPNVPDAPILPVVDEVLRGQTEGVYFEKEVYSMFANPLAERFLRALVDRMEAPPTFFVFGVATDYCVRAAALGLAERGHRTALVTDAIAGITPEGTARALEEMQSAGVRLTRAAEVLS